MLYKIFSHWEKTTLHLISDTHFNDSDLALGIPNRPSAQELVNIINSKVGRKDVLIHLGDVGDLDYTKQLRGYKILVCGNHDKGASNYEEVFDEIYTGPLIINDKIILSHEPITIPGMFNIHGHNHSKGSNDFQHLNVCCDVLDGYLPLNFKQLYKNGLVSKVSSIHRQTIDKATERRKKNANRRFC